MDWLWPSLSLELAKALSRSRKDFHIYFCSTCQSCHSTKLSPSIQFVELHLSSSLELPPYLHTTNSRPPPLGPTLHQAFSTATPRFEAILQILSLHLLIYDSFHPTWAPQIASSLNIPAINFNITEVSIISHVVHRDHYPNSILGFL